MLSQMYDLLSSDEHKQRYLEKYSISVGPSKLIHHNVLMLMSCKLMYETCSEAMVNIV